MSVHIMHTTKKIKNIASNSIAELKSYLKDAWCRLFGLFRGCVKKSKNLSKTNMNLGLYHYYAGHFNDAATRFSLLSWFGADSARINYNLGRCYYMLGKNKKAVKYLNKSLDTQSDLVESEYFLRKINDPVSVNTVPFAVIKERFNYLADSGNGNDFCGEWQQNLLLHSMRSYFANSSLRVLDLGCGAGILGGLLRKYIAHFYLEGVDISSKMLEHADILRIQDIKAYNNLFCAEISQFLRNCNTKYDIILSRGAFNYLGLSEQVLHLCHNALNSRGTMAFFVGKSQRYLEFMPYRDKFIYSVDYLTDAAYATQFFVSATQEIKDDFGDESIYCTLSLIE